MSATPWQRSSQCVDGQSCYRCAAIVGSRSWNVRPLAGAPIAVIDQPAPSRVTLAMICAVCVPDPVSS